MLDGYITIKDDEMYKLLGMMYKTEQLKLEPSALAGVPGIVHVLANDAYLDRMQLKSKLANATHLVWATGGGMVPTDEMNKYLERAELVGLS